MVRQETFISTIKIQLENRGFVCQTLGTSNYDMDAPLTAIRRMMLESNGILVVAFRRYWIEVGEENRGTDIPRVRRSDMAGRWMTSPWPHIETAMGFQLGLPILTLREEGVHADGLLDRGARPGSYPEFDLSATDSFLNTGQWLQISAQWESRVRQFHESKGRPGPLAGD
jgi:hypothetical protein